MSQQCECDVCFEQFNDQERIPRILSCGHSFCTACLELFARRAKIHPFSGTMTIDCSVCRKQTALPNDGVAGLPKNFALLGFLEAGGGGAGGGSSNGHGGESPSAATGPASTGDKPVETDENSLEAQIQALLAQRARMKQTKLQAALETIQSKETSILVRLSQVEIHRSAATDQVRRLLEQAREVGAAVRRLEEEDGSLRAELRSTQAELEDIRAQLARCQAEQEGKAMPEASNGVAPQSVSTAGRLQATTSGPLLGSGAPSNISLAGSPSLPNGQALSIPSSPFLSQASVSVVPLVHVAHASVNGSGTYLAAATTAAGSGANASPASDAAAQPQPSQPSPSTMGSPAAAPTSAPAPAPTAAASTPRPAPRAWTALTQPPASGSRGQRAGNRPPGSDSSFGANSDSEGDSDDIVGLSGPWPVPSSAEASPPPAGRAQPRAQGNGTAAARQAGSLTAPAAGRALSLPPGVNIGPRPKSSMASSTQDPGATSSAAPSPAGPSGSGDGHGASSSTAGASSGSPSTRAPRDKAEKLDKSEREKDKEKAREARKKDKAEKASSSGGSPWADGGAVPEGHPKFRTVKCWHFTSPRGCKRGDECAFLHSA